MFKVLDNKVFLCQDCEEFPNAGLSTGPLLSRGGGWYEWWCILVSMFCTNVRREREKTRARRCGISQDHLHTIENLNWFVKIILHAFLSILILVLQRKLRRTDKPTDKLVYLRAWGESSTCSFESRVNARRDIYNIHISMYICIPLNSIVHTFAVSERFRKLQLAFVTVDTKSLQ